jgi:hypothetical protein
MPTELVFRRATGAPVASTMSAQRNACNGLQPVETPAPVQTSALPGSHPKPDHPLTAKIGRRAGEGGYAPLAVIGRSTRSARKRTFVQARANVRFRPIADISTSVTLGAAGGRIDYVHFHLPKPLHGWREFVGEVGVIVLSILIALALERAVASIQDRQAAREAREAINAEMREDLERIASHLAHASCNDRRLDEIASLLRDWKAGTAPPAGLNIGDPGDTPLLDQRWQANLNSGRFNQQPPAAQAQQSAFYTQIGILNVVLDREHTAWSRLRALELGPGLLSPEMRGGLTEVLAGARADARDLRLLGQDVVRSSARTLGSPRPSPGVDLMGSACGPMLPQGHS